MYMLSKQPYLRKMCQVKSIDHELLNALLFHKCVRHAPKDLNYWFRLNLYFAVILPTQNLITLDD